MSIRASDMRQTLTATDRLRQSAEIAGRGGGTPTLEIIGLAPSAARAYRMLLRLPTASIGDLAAGLGMSIVDVRTTLRGLEARGLVGRLPGAANRFRAAPPDRALGTLVRNRRRELRTIRADVDALSTDYDTGHLRTRSSVHLVTGAATVHAQAARLIAAATLDVCTVSPVVSGAFDDVATPVRIRAIHPRSALTRPDDRGHILHLLRAGHDVRTAARPPVDMLIVDRSVALLPVHGETADGPATAAVLVWPGGLHDTLLAEFERTWSVAATLRADGGDLVEEQDQGVPTPEDLRLLELLLDGRTDQAIAGRLGVGERTVQRRVRDLIDFVGVQTRLQLIWQASQRGWI
jgi:DNA-binding CsgD family transcriptional regulator